MKRQSLLDRISKDGSGILILSFFWTNVDNTGPSKGGEANTKAKFTNRRSGARDGISF